MSDRPRPPATGPWRPPTRRAFVAMLGAAAAALVAPRAAPPVDPPRATTRWIGHC